MKGKIFNAQEVQSMIAGNKTQFREVIKPQPIGDKTTLVECPDNKFRWVKFGDNVNVASDLFNFPYQVGEKIFCKESFLQKLGSTQLPSGEHETFFTGSEVEYVEDGAQERWDNPDVYYPNWWKKRPAQHMKQEHSRLFLQITEIRVKRLQDISEEDAIAEGLDFKNEHSQLCFNIEDQTYSNDLIDGSAVKTIFAKNWNATHKKPEEKFEASPWVWVIEFKQV